MQYLIATWLYAAIPPLALAGILLRRKTRRTISSQAVLSTAIHGTAVGLGLAVLYAVLLRAHVAVSQFLIAAYGGIAMVSVLRLLNWSLLRGLERLLVRPAAAGTPGSARRGVALAGVLRAVLLLAIGIPYVASLLLVFRIKAIHPGTPETILHAPYQQVAFTSSDGVSLAGWWIPATGSSHGQKISSRMTVILCPGLGADQASDLFLVSKLVPTYNILTFDFRGTGQSGGQFTTFGDTERRDVLAAVHWLRTNRPQQCHRIYGLGESTGAAALLAAAADEGPDGQAIDKVAVYDPYADLSEILQTQCRLRAGAPVAFLTTRLAMPLAGWELGCDLAHFAPMRDAEQIWPRPLLVIASASGNGIIDFEESRKVYDNAQPPKRAAWLTPPADLKKSLSFNALHEDSAADDVGVFFLEVPSIL